MSNPTTRGKYKLLQLGEGLNSWGLSSGLNGGVFERLDEAVHGVQEITLTSTSYTLTTTNYVENDIRYRILSFSGNFAATISIPASTENWWIIKNSTGQILTFSNGSNSATIGVGFYGLVHTNGTTVDSLTLPDGVNVQTVATNISSVNQVATDSASVIAVAGKSTEVGRLGTTAAVADLASLGGTSEVANLAALAPRAADIGTLAPRAADLQALAPREADLNTLSPRAADIGTLAPRASDLQALAPREADLNTLSPRASDLQTLSPRASDIGTLADLEDGTTATNALSTLAPRSSDMQTLAPRASDMQTLSGISSAITGVNAISSDVTALNTNPLKQSILDVGSNATNINTVATNQSAISNVSSNISNVNNFNDLYQISASTPSTDGGGNALSTGDLFFDSSVNELKIFNGSAFQGGVTATGNLLAKSSNLSDLASATTARTNLGLDALFAAKAPLASPTFTGTLASPTINASTALQIGGVAISASAAELNYNDVTTLGTTEASKTVTADANGVVTFANGKIEESTAITSSSNAATINLRDGDNFTHTLSENVTYTFSNPAANGKVSAFTLKVTQDSTARTITWPTSVDWAAATAPTLSTDSGAIDVFVFTTYDGGTTYYGFTAGQAMG